MSKIEEELKKIFNGQGSQDLTTFLERKANSKFFRKKTEKEILRLLPYIISNTNSNNCGWLEIFRLYSIDGFIDILVGNLDKLEVNNSEVMIMKLFEQLQLKHLTEDNVKKLINKLNCIDCKITESTLDLICYHIKVCNLQLLKESFNSFLQNENICNAALNIAPRYLGENIYKDLIGKNSDFLINHVENLYQLKEKVAFNEELLEKVNNKINQDANKNVTNLVKENCNRFYSSNDLHDHHKNYDTFVEITKLIIEDLCKNEKVSPSEIEWLGRGTFSSVLGIGSKVLKIGSKRGTKTFPNNPYINATLLRREFKISEEISFFIEVNEKVNTKTNIENEELYQLYKKVRDIGLIWTDVARRNVGRLLKDNNISWRQELPITEERLELKEYREGQNLQKGDLVILDNDHIYDENDNPEEINLYATDFQKKFEERYQNELTKNEQEESHKNK